MRYTTAKRDARKGDAVTFLSSQPQACDASPADSLCSTHCSAIASGLSVPHSRDRKTDFPHQVRTGKISAPYSCRTTFLVALENRAGQEEKNGQTTVTTLQILAES